MTDPVHVQMSADATFCGGRGHALSMEAWQRDPSTIQKATCDACLLKIFMLGDSATIALRNQGKRVDVHDVDEASLGEN